MKINQTDLLRTLCRSSYYDFVRTFWGTIVPEKPVWNWHIPYLCGEMQEAAERVFKNQPKLWDGVVNICPGSTKSTIASIMFMPWVWTRMPSARCIGASFAHDLALDLSRRSRDVTRSELYKKLFPEIIIRPDQDTKGYYMNTKGGFRLSVGSEGDIIGRHAHFIIVDDPINPRKAMSDVEMKNVNTWMREELFSRKVDKAVTVTFLVMQRIRQGDPSEEMIGRDRVRHIKIPAEDCYDVQPEDLRQHYKNGLMDPVRLPRDVLKGIEKDMGPYGYSGQYGQDPVPAGGGMFKTSLIRWGIPPEMKRIVRFWDKAGTLDSGAFSVGLKMGLDKDNRIWIMDVIRQQLDSYHRERLIRMTANMDGHGVTIGVEQEGGSGGLESAEGTMRRLLGFRVKAIRPVGKKEIRADEFSTQVNAGNVYLACVQAGPGLIEGESKPTGIAGYIIPSWHKPYLEEMKYFPLSRYKDQIDASAGAFTLLVGGAKIRVGGLLPRQKQENPHQVQVKIGVA